MPELNEDEDDKNSNRLNDRGFGYGSQYGDGFGGVYSFANSNCYGDLCDGCGAGLGFSIMDGYSVPSEWEGILC